jgi:hypothetical protein
LSPDLNRIERIEAMDARGRMASGKWLLGRVHSNWMRRILVSAQKLHQLAEPGRKSNDKSQPDMLSKSHAIR